MSSRFVPLFALFAALPALAADPLLFAPVTFDSGISVCEDPYLHVNADWLRTTEVPADRPMWGPRYIVIERNQQMQRELAERAAAQAARGEAQGDAALISAFFASGMDETRIDAAGIRPIAADLARIDAIASREDLFAFIAASSAQGLNLVFDHYVWARGEDPDRHIIYVEQGGRGMVDRERYVGDDEASKTMRTAYRAHLAKLLTLSGIPATDAQRQAEAAFAVEQALARASLSIVQLRDLNNVFAVRKLQEAKRIAPYRIVDEAGDIGQFRLEYDVSGTETSYLLNVVSARDAAQSPVVATLQDLGDVWQVSLTHPQKGSATLTLRKGETSTGGSVRIGQAAAIPLRENRQGMAITDGGVFWEGGECRISSSGGRHPVCLSDAALQPAPRRLGAPVWVPGSGTPPIPHRPGRGR